MAPDAQSVQVDLSSEMQSRIRDFAKDLASQDYYEVLGVEREVDGEAIREALAEEMRRDESVYLLGEDVTTGGYFAVTSGLVDEFGPGRVVDTPISEYAIVGSSVGAAMTGRRPIAEIQSIEDPERRVRGAVHFGGRERGRRTESKRWAGEYFFCTGRRG